METIRIDIMNDKNEKAIACLENVLYVPDINSKLLFVKRFAENDFAVKFSNDMC